MNLEFVKKQFDDLAEELGVNILELRLSEKKENTPSWTNAKYYTINVCEEDELEPIESVKLFELEGELEEIDQYAVYMDSISDEKIIQPDGSYKLYMILADDIKYTLRCLCDDYGSFEEEELIDDFFMSPYFTWTEDSELIVAEGYDFYIERVNH